MVKLKEPQFCGAQRRIFDENSYWAPAAQSPLDDKTELEIDLSDLYKYIYDDGVLIETLKVDPSRVYMIGIWSTGHNTVAIEDIYLETNKNESYFPLEDGAIDTGIWGTNTYDAETKTIKYHDSFNSVGWTFAPHDVPGYDFSDYQYLVVEFQEAPENFIEAKILV